MKTLKKGCAAVLATCLLAFPVVGLTACGKDTASKDPKEITVRMFAGGFGSDWMYELESKFEKAYEAEGYKVKIMTPKSDMRSTTALQDMEMYNGKIDLYVIGNVFPYQIGVNGEYGVLAEDIRESVWNQKAIRYDGTEEELTVGEKINPDCVPFLEDKDGTMYGYNYAQSSAGLVVNTRKLKQYGINTLPKTTNEMFDMWEKIFLGSGGKQGSAKTTTYPMTFVPGTNGYVNCAFNVWMAQYDIDQYNSFWSMKDVTTGERMVDNGYEVYNYQTVREMLPVAYHAMDTNLTPNGTQSQTLDQAQAKIMKAAGNDAVFMFNGDWMLNEVKLNYKKNLNDIEFINMPVISALGVKLFGTGTDYNLSEENCDKVLSAIVGLTDENKEIAEMVAAVKALPEYAGVTGVSDEKLTTDVTYVANARGIVYSRGVEHLAYITKKSQKKDIAALFLRMMASDDFAQTFASLSNASTPYGTQTYESTYKFVNDAASVANNKYLHVIGSNLSGLREEMRTTCSTMLSGVSHLPSAIYAAPASMYTIDGKKDPTKDESVYKSAGLTMVQSSYSDASSKWATWKESCGITA